MEEEDPETRIARREEGARPGGGAQWFQNTLSQNKAVWTPYNFKSALFLFLFDTTPKTMKKVEGVQKKVNAFIKAKFIFF